MSLWCGACRTCIYGKYGILYLLSEKEDWRLKHPDRGDDYTPPNSAVCGDCMSDLSPDLASETAIRSSETFAFSWDIGPDYADGDYAKWSAIMIDENNFDYLSRELVVKKLPKALAIIEDVIWRRAMEVAVDKRLGESCKFCGDAVDQDYDARLYDADEDFNGGELGHVSCEIKRKWDNSDGE